MADWLYEAGIGENRAVRIEDGAIIEAAIELPDRLRAGAIRKGRLSVITTAPRLRGIVALDGGGEALLEPIPPGLSEGGALTVEIVREAIPERGRAKLPKCRCVTDQDERDGPDLRERLIATGHRVRALSPIGPDPLEAAGWSELLEEAATGEIAFEGGALRMSLTPAMTLFDVDGVLPPARLAVAGAEAAARAICRFDIGGSIGLDLPTSGGKADRQAAAAAVDAVLPQPFERTAVNGFGFLQIVRRRDRASLPELLQADPVAARARALMRRAERAPGAGLRTLAAAPPVIAHLRKPEWIEALERRIGAPVALRAEPGLAISAGHVHVEHA